MLRTLGDADREHPVTQGRERNHARRDTMVDLDNYGRGRKLAAAGVVAVVLIAGAFLIGRFTAPGTGGRHRIHGAGDQRRRRVAPLQGGAAHRSAGHRATRRRPRLDRPQPGRRARPHQPHRLGGAVWLHQRRARRCSGSSQCSDRRPLAQTDHGRPLGHTRLSGRRSRRKSPAVSGGTFLAGAGQRASTCSVQRTTTVAGRWYRPHRLRLRPGRARG